MIFSLLALLLAAQPSAAQTCPPPPAFAAWASPAPAGPALVPGRAARVALGPFAASGIAASPGHNEGPNARGGRIGLDIATAGTYRIALDTGAWIDLARGGQVLSSAAHEHGPACGTIRKIVDFRLEPGHYELRISGTEAAAVLVLIVPA